MGEVERRIRTDLHATTSSRKAAEHLNCMHVVEFGDKFTTNLLPSVAVKEF